MASIIAVLFLVQTLVSGFSTETKSAAASRAANKEQTAKRIAIVGAGVRKIRLESRSSLEMHYIKCHIGNKLFFLASLYN